jgi:CHAT domain
MDYLDCKLTIMRENRVKYEFPPSRAGVIIKAELCADPLTKRTVERLNRFVAKYADFCQHDDLRLLGQHLYHILFDGKTMLDGIMTETTLGERFLQEYAQFEQEFERRQKQTGKAMPDYRLRVTLVFEEEMAELAGYPWEFLYVPRPDEKGFFIVGEITGLILARCLPRSPLVNALRKAEEKLVILVAWAQPRELGPVDERDTVAAIQKLAEAIERDINGQNIQVIPLPNATHQALKELIETSKPQIVHFLGHGRIQERTSQIALMKSQAEIDRAKFELLERGAPGKPEEANWVDSNSIRALFQAAPPNLVFLHACQSARAPDSLTVFRSTAEQVLRAGVPAVVAMQYEISNADAAFFAKTFYEKIGQRMSILEAVKAGRIELGRKDPSWGHPRFGTPVAYLQGEDDAIVCESIAKAGQVENYGAEASSAPPGKISCPYPSCIILVSPDQRRCSCNKKQKLKQCSRCHKPNPYDETECLFCDAALPGEKLTVQSAGPAEQVTSGPPASFSIPPSPPST